MNPGGHAAPLTVREATHVLLRELGLTTVFGNPGSTELPMFAELPSDFRYVLGLQESVATSMADGYSQATGRAALVSLHSAAGIGHAMGALYTARKNRTPLVVISGQQARSLLGGEPYLCNEQPDVLPSPYAKWSREPARAQDVPAAIARAYHLAMSPPQGPTTVSVPVDDWNRDIHSVPTARSVSTRVGAQPELLAECGRALSQATCPVFVAGAEVDRDGAFDDLVALAQRHQARVYAAPMSHRCSFPEDHPLFAGFLPPTHAGIAEALSGSDLVLVLGAPVFTFHVAGSGALIADGVTLWLVTDDPALASWSPVGGAMLASVGLAVRSLLAEPAPSRPAPPPRARPDRVQGGGAIDTALLMQTVDDVRPAGLVIVEEAPSSRPTMCERLPNLRAGSFYTCASGALGYALPAAVGHALGRPDGRVLAVVGDGSVMYSVQALWTAAKLGVPLTVLVVNNRSYATVDNFARRFGISKPVGTTLGGLDFVGLARAQGCAGARVAHASELADALRSAFAATGPYLLEVPVAN